MECMAVQPALQEVNQTKLIQSNIGVLCNVREDHLEEMGPTLDDVARSLSRSMPVGGVCITAEQERYDVLAARRRTVATAGWSLVDPESVTDEEMDRFDWFTFKENVAIALAVAAEVGIDRDAALRGMWAAPPDPGVLTVETYRVGTAPPSGSRTSSRPTTRSRRSPTCRSWPAAARSSASVPRAHQLPSGPRRAQRPDGLDRSRSLDAIGRRSSSAIRRESATGCDPGGLERARRRPRRAGTTPRGDLARDRHGGRGRARTPAPRCWRSATSTGRASCSWSTWTGWESSDERPDTRGGSHGAGARPRPRARLLPRHEPVARRHDHSRLAGHDAGGRSAPDHHHRRRRRADVLRDDWACRRWSSSTASGCSRRSS